MNPSAVMRGIEKMAKSRHFLVVVEGDVEPHIHSEHDDRQSIVAAAKEKRAKSDEDGVFHLVIDDKGNPMIYPFLASEIDPEPEPQ